VPFGSFGFSFVLTLFPLPYILSTHGGAAFRNRI